jgi:hypothetical protein
MSRSAEEYVEDRAARYPRATRSDLIGDEYRDMTANVVVSLVVYGLITWALWFYASPDWAKGAGFAYLGVLFSETVETLGRIRAFKRLMPED